MFVCHGNICRSPMAEFIMKKLVAEAGLQDEFVIASSATSTEEIWNGIGNPVYPPAKAELKKHGISCAGKTAVQLKREDYPNYDYFIGMDAANIRNMQQIFQQDPDGKIYRLLTFAGRQADIADPWYSGDFATTFSELAAGCSGLLAALQQEKGKEKHGRIGCDQSKNHQPQRDW